VLAALVLYLSVLAFSPRKAKPPAMAVPVRHEKEYA
jgi:hypothetical protein